MAHELVMDALRELGRQGWTCGAVARELGASRPTVSRWRSGRQAPDFPDMVLLALERLSTLPAPPQAKRGPKKGWRLVK